MLTISPQMNNVLQYVLCDFSLLQRLATILYYTYQYTNYKTLVNLLLDKLYFADT